MIGAGIPSYTLPEWHQDNDVPTEFLVAEWIHFTLFGMVSPTINPKVYTFGGLMNSATKFYASTVINQTWKA